MTVTFDLHTQRGKLYTSVVLAPIVIIIIVKYIVNWYHQQHTLSVFHLHLQCLVVQYYYAANSSNHTNAHVVFLWYSIQWKVVKWMEGVKANMGDRPTMWYIQKIPLIQPPEMRTPSVLRTLYNVPVSALQYISTPWNEDNPLIMLYLDKSHGGPV